MLNSFEELCIMRVECSTQCGRVYIYIYIYVVTCHEYSKPVDRASTEIEYYENVSYLFMNSKRSDVHINMSQKMFRGDYDTITQNNAIRIILFSHL